MNVGDYIRKSEILSNVKGFYIKSEDLLRAYPKLSNIEKKSLVLHYIMDNSPFAFTDVYELPLLFEQVRQYISYILDVDVNHVKLIGSTKTGFKMDTINYGASYSKTSDLDFMIIDERLFSTLKEEFEVWRRIYVEDRGLMPNNDREKECWDNNIAHLPQNIDRGFLDTKLMPNRQQYLPMNSKVNNAMYMITRNLKSQYGFETKGASMRVYKNVDSYFNQQMRNIEAILKARRG